MAVKLLILLGTLQSLLQDLPLHGYQSGIDSTGFRTDYETGTTGYESITGLHGIYLNTLYNSNR